MNEKIPEINLNIINKIIDTKIIKYSLTIRDCYYHGFIGKISVIYHWITKHRYQTFKEFLDSPVKYTMEEPNMNEYSYQHINCEKEILESLEKELTTKNNAEIN